MRKTKEKTIKNEEKQVKDDVKKIGTGGVDFGVINTNFSIYEDMTLKFNATRDNHVYTAEIILKEI